MKHKTELKPCPFCGAEAEILIDLNGMIEGATERFWAYNVVCKQCRATTGLTWSSEMAVDAWNRRAEKNEDDGRGCIMDDIKRIFRQFH